MKTIEITLENKCIKVHEESSITYILKFPYNQIKEVKKDNKDINNFIVYILFEEMNKIVYIGKSINGLDDRLESHLDKLPNDIKWTNCFVITQEKELSKFNDGSIQYLENKISVKFKDCGKQYNISTDKTNGKDKGKTANDKEKPSLDKTLEQIYDLLYTLGFNLYEENTDNSNISAKTANTKKTIDDDFLNFNGRKKLEKLFSSYLKLYTIDQILDKLKDTKYCKNKNKLCSKVKCWDKKYSGAIKELKDINNNILFLFTNYSNNDINKICDDIQNIMKG